MRQGRPSKHEIEEMDQIDRLNKLKEEPHLSGAYIRSLVKQLTSSKTKESMNPKDLDSSTSVDADAVAIPAQDLTKFGEGGLDETQHTRRTQQQQPHQQHKKQVRRRLHTSRPYQERLLNMAEARREIVTALKFHRAAMKQASEQQQQQQQLQQQQQSPLVQPPTHEPHVEQQARMKSRRNPRIYPSTTTSNNFSNYLDKFLYPQNFSHPAPPNPYAWPASPITTLPFTENLNFSLPNQTLGLNLNFQDFNNIETSLYHNSNNNPSFYSTSTNSNSVSSPSSSSSPTLSTAVDQELVPVVGPPAVGADHGFESSATTSGGGGGGGGGLHAAMDDEEMEEIRSIGEQHQMEWNDTMNLMTSAWWFKFLKTMELGGPDDHMKGGDHDIDGYHPFDEVMEFPAWLSANESDNGCFQQHFDDYYCPEDYFQNPALPW